jgi:hypothetical protein
MILPHACGIPASTRSPVRGNYRGGLACLVGLFIICGKTYNERMNKRTLPLGVQTFSRIREENLVYIDKTEQIYRMITWESAPLLLFRPRRFGKSLLCSTLAALFEGRRELFKGLAIDSLDWNWKNYPVIYIDFNIANYTSREGFLATINSILEGYENKYGVPNVSPDFLCGRFLCLIHNVSEKHDKKVVVIIDDYDKPMLDTINDPQIQKDIINELCGFFAVIKSSDEYLKFVLLSGLTKFSHETFSSNLNSLRDTSFDEEYCALCGITQAELEACFEPEIERCAAKNGLARQDYLDKLKQLYNGYRFSGEELTVYNPSALFKHFDSDGKFDTDWLRSDTPPFLTELLKTEDIDYLKQGKIYMSYLDFHRFNLERMSVLAGLYQYGYLTITGYEAEMFVHFYLLGCTNEMTRSLLGFDS